MVKNSRKHKKEISKDIKKRIKKIAKQSRADTGDVSTGSRIVKRTRADISKAPAYKPEKLKTSNFHSTFPVSNGLSLFDEQMNMQRLFQQGLKRQKQQNEFKLLIDQGLAGNVDLDNMTNDMKQELAKQYAMQENDNKKNKMLKEIDRIQAQREKLNNENLRLAEKHKGLQLMTRSKKGEDKIVSKKVLQNKVNKDRGVLEQIQEKSQILKQISNKDEILQKARETLKDEKKQLEKVFRSRPPSEQNSQIMRAIDQEDMMQLKRIHDNFKRENDAVHENIKLFREYGEKITKYLEDKHEMDMTRREIQDMGDRTGNLTKKLVDLESMYGNDQERLHQKIHEETDRLIEQGKKIREITTNLRDYQRGVEEFGRDYDEKLKEVKRHAQNVIAMDPYTPSDIKELAYNKMLNSQQIKTTLNQLTGRKYEAHEAYALEVEKIYSNVLYHDREMAEWDQGLRAKLLEFLEPVVNHYATLDTEFDEDEIEKEKAMKSWEVWKNVASLVNVDANVRLTEFRKQKEREQRAREAEEVDPEREWEALFGPREES